MFHSVNLTPVSIALIVLFLRLLHQRPLLFHHSPQHNSLTFLFPLKTPYLFTNPSHCRLYASLTTDYTHYRLDRFYSAPQCSHCKRCTSYGNSMCLSVCPSVCHTPVLCQIDGTYSTVQFPPLYSKMCLVL